MKYSWPLVMIVMVLVNGNAVEIGRKLWIFFCGRIIYPDIPDQLWKPAHVARILELEADSRQARKKIVMRL